MANKVGQMKTCSKKPKLKSSKGENYEKPVWSCDYCQKEFSHLSNLKQHVTVHTGQKDYHCNFCDYSAAHKGNLHVHIRRHLMERPFKCQQPNCEASFTSSGDLKSHQLVHNKNGERFSCPVCAYKANRKDSLTQHMKNIHSESRSFKCPHENCEYSAKRETHLHQHLKIHSEEKNEVCAHPNCGYKTKRSADLKLHMKIHSNEEKRFKCQFCDYSCHQHSHLVVHIRRHTGETPYACQLCPYESNQKSNVDKHMKTHADFETK